MIKNNFGNFKHERQAQNANSREIEILDGPKWLIISLYKLELRNRSSA